MERVVVQIDSDATLPFWRGAQVFRFASVAYAIGAQIVSVNADTFNHSGIRAYSHPLISWMLIALLVIWSGVSGLIYAFELAPRAPIVVLELVITALLTISTVWVVRPEYFHHHQSLPSTFWITNAVVSVALLWGPIAGGVTGVGFSLLSLGIEQQFHNIVTDATTPILLTVGVTLGIGARIVSRAQQELSAAVRMQAATKERERLSREVHDGTLQVLALMRRRGADLGGEAAELGRLAGQQEQALRTLISEQAPVPGIDESTDLRSQLQAALPTDANFSAPADAVQLPSPVVTELVAVVRTILDNVEQHAGDGARTFLLLEDLGDEVVLTVRDDGVGIPDGRLAEAESQGRMGVSKSIRGRMADLGGEALLETGPDLGTEWELHVPRIDGQDEGRE
ncbi:MacS family sensor histidine kinase [Flexivirga oryzae]|uniref:Signal transduction histidine kinase n=1 Tax=Flexivirga oryzae TaxID=1794944 RepID=A0A839N8N7_9MICO|nr:ATP-binding protein [Flexivirga oryzae]MBB2894130.1 signal transduction histidine kinase [Flexivirga oryzae]